MLHNLFYSPGPESDPECDPGNYVQFGRDILFITTHLSPRLCSNNTDMGRRHYTEIQVRGMLCVFIPISNSSSSWMV